MQPPATAAINGGAPVPPSRQGRPAPGQSEPQEPSALALEARRSGLVRLGVALSVLFALCLLPYMVESLSFYRPWVPGEPLPFEQLFTRVGALSGDVGIAAPQLAASSSPSRAVAETLGTTVAQNLDDDAELAEMRRMREAEQAEQAERAAADKPERSHEPPLGEGTLPSKQPDPSGTAPSEPAAQPATPTPPARAKLPAALRLTDEDLKGVARSLEDPSGLALDSLWSALVGMARGEEPARVIFAHWGDSTIALDGITSTLRRRLQQRFGDAGHGFVLGGKGYLPYGHKDMDFSENGQWDLATIIKGGRGDGRYGYGGTLFRSSGGAFSRFGTVKSGPIGTEVDAFEVFYAAHRRGGKLELKLNDEAPIVVDTRLGDEEEAQVVDRFHRVKGTLGANALRVRAAGGGEVRLYGVSLERGERGLIYDSLGIVGARASRLLNYDVKHLEEQLGHRRPTVLVLQFGGNEAVDRHMKMDWYHAKLTEVVQHLRGASPHSACLLMGPLDQGERDDRGRVRTIPIVPKIVETQRKVAFEQGCAYWSTFEAMGGEGSMGRWFDAKPRLGWGDFIHATPAGYEVIGNMAYKALLEGLQMYLKREGLVD